MEHSLETPLEKDVGMKKTLLALLALAMILSVAPAAEGLEVLFSGGEVKYRPPADAAGAAPAGESEKSREQKDVVSVKKGDVLAEDGRIMMGDGAELELRSAMGDVMKFKDKCYVRISTLFRDGEKNKSGLSLNLFRGNLKSQVAKLSQDSFFEVKTPVAVAGVRGTEFECTVEESGATVVEVQSGTIEIRDPEGVAPAVPVGVGQKASVSSSGAVKVQIVQPKADSARPGAAAPAGGPAAAPEAGERAPEAGEEEENSGGMEFQEIQSISDEITREIMDVITQELQQRRDEEVIEERVQQSKELQIKVNVKDIE